MNSKNENIRLDDFLTYSHLLSKLVFHIKSQTIKESDLKNIHVMCLFYLEYKGPLTFKEIVKYTLEDKAAISKALKTLKYKKLIAYNNNYNEKIELTEEGDSLGKKILFQSHSALNQARKGISDEQAQIFIDSMKKIIKNLEDFVE